jgi:hypothetical protein
MILIVIIVLFFVHVIFIQEADAYLDPGTGSYILQVIIAASVAGLYIIKLFWNKIKAFFKNLFTR